MGFYTFEKDNEELSLVQAHNLDLQIEEFPEGPYGAKVYLNQKIGKSSEWKPGQQVISRFKDENPAFSNRKVPEDEQKPDF